MHRLILFDIGHVLVQLTGTALIKKFAQFELSDEQIHATWLTIPGVRRFETGLCSEHEFATDVIAFYNLRLSVDAFVNHFRNAAERKFTGVDGFLERLAASHELACLTNTNPLQWPRISEGFGLGKYFPKQYVSYQLGLMKPDAAIYEHVLRDCGLAPGEILFVDDNTHNCDAARALGIDTCHVKNFDDARSQVIVKIGKAIQ